MFLWSGGMCKGEEFTFTWIARFIKQSFQDCDRNAASGQNKPNISLIEIESEFFWGQI